MQSRRQELCCHYNDTAEWKHYSVSLQNKVAAKNRWRNLQHKSPSQRNYGTTHWSNGWLYSLTVSRTKNAWEKWKCRLTDWSAASWHSSLWERWSVSWGYGTRRRSSRGTPTKQIYAVKVKWHKVILIPVTGSLSPSAPLYCGSCWVDGESGSQSSAGAETEGRKRTPPAKRTIDTTINKNTLNFLYSQVTTVLFILLWSLM